MILQVTSVEYLHDYQLWLRLNDNSEGVVDLDGELWGTVFDSLNDLTLFSQAKLDKELATVVWPNGADFAPEFLNQMSLRHRPRQSLRLRPAFFSKDLK